MLFYLTFNNTKMGYVFILILTYVFIMSHLFLQIGVINAKSIKDNGNKLYFNDINNITGNIVPCNRKDLNGDIYTGGCITTGNLFIPNTTGLSINLTGTRIETGHIYNWKLGLLGCAVYQGGTGKVNVNNENDKNKLENIIHIDSNNVDDIINNRPYSNFDELSGVGGLTGGDVNDIINEGKAYLFEILNGCN